jgi:hypothetical protein
MLKRSPRVATQEIRKLLVDYITSLDDESAEALWAELDARPYSRIDVYSLLNTDGQRRQLKQLGLAAFIRDRQEARAEIIGLLGSSFSDFIRGMPR